MREKIKTRSERREKAELKIIFQFTISDGRYLFMLGVANVPNIWHLPHLPHLLWVL